MIKNLRHFTVIPALALLLVAGSCAKQEIDRINPLEGGDGNQPMLVAVKGLPAYQKDANDNTKGTPITNANSDSLFKANGGLKIWTFITDNSNKKSAYFDDVLTDWGARETSDQWPISAGWATGYHYYWPKSLPLDFWSIAPNNAITSGYVTNANVNTEANPNTLSFSYATPKSSDGKSDAVSQPDVAVAFDGAVVFGMEGHVSDGNTYGVLNFQHVFSGVRFVGGVVSEGKLTYIKIKNVLSQGTCTYTPSSSPSIVWSDTVSQSDFTQKFDVQLNECTEITTPDDYQMITDSIDENGDTVTVRTFMFIPQDVKKVLIDLEFDGDLYENVPLYVKKEDGTSTPEKWESGKMYTYVLNIQGGNVYVDVEEEFDKAVKQNVVSVNTGKQDSYMRMAVVANWVDSEGNIVESCDWMTSGVDSLGWATDDSKLWQLQADGYFYYKHAIKRRDEITSGDDEGKFTCYTTSSLFKSFTPGLPPREGLDLEMIIIAQSVQYDKDKKHIKTAWGDAAAGFVSTEIKSDHSVVRESVPDAKTE